ncbi:MAG: HEAT repeat domain-containing protein [Kofleriaceae bacterium]
MTRCSTLIAFGALVVFAAALPAHGDGSVLNQRVIDVLTPIDYVPSSRQLDMVFGTEALSSLTTLAHADDPLHIDPQHLGVQLRAIRALTNYCASPCVDLDPAHLAVVELIDVDDPETPEDSRYRTAQSGGDLLVLRAVIESLGVLRVQSDMQLLLPYLNHLSRDVRASTAYALKDLGNTQAIAPLRARYQQEQNPQVRIAISDALRVLQQPPP